MDDIAVTSSLVLKLIIVDIKTLKGFRDLFISIKLSTAVGSDTHEKCELDSKILAKADLVVADSLEQNLLRGEIHQALKKECIAENKIVEIGEIFNRSQPGRTASSQISVADLTGVAVQDLVIAESVYRAHLDN